MAGEKQRGARATRGAGQVQNIDGAIGYVEYAYATRTNSLRQPD